MPVTREEWRWVVGFAAIVMLLTTLPYVAGWLAAGDAWTFGGFLFGTDDGNSYLAKMRLGARGEWLFTLRYTHEPHAGALLFLPYLLLGRLAALVVDPESPRLYSALLIAFHGARIVCGGLLIAVCYRFAAVFLPERAQRRFALALIALGGGLGWGGVLFGAGDIFGSLPLDWFVPESTTFLILYGLPHLALARAALLGGLLLLFRALTVPGWARASLRWAIPAGLLWMVMGLCVPFYIAVLYALLGAWGLALWGRARRFPRSFALRAGLAALIPLPLLAYTAAVFLTNDALGRWSAQNILPTPHPFHYVLGYGMLALWAVPALRQTWPRAGSGAPSAALLIAWVIAVPVLIYLPINVQRRLGEAVIVPLSLLATAGLRAHFRTPRAWRRARIAMLALLLPTSALLLLGGTFTALAPARPVFHPRAELAALDRLNALAPRDAVVLCLKETGNLVPARTDLIAYVGHGPETLNSRAKEHRAAQFFAGQLHAVDRRALLAQVDYVYWGLLERAQAGAPPRDPPPELRQVAELGAGIVLFEVVHDDQD